MIHLSKSKFLSIYKVGINFIVIDDLDKEACDYFKDDYSDSRWPEYRDAGGLVHHSDPRFENEFFIFIEKTSLTHGLISHEIAHACWSVLKLRGVEIGKHAEALTHLIQWITDWVYICLKKKGLKVQIDTN